MIYLPECLNNVGQRSNCVREMTFYRKKNPLKGIFSGHALIPGIDEWLIPGLLTTSKALSILLYPSTSNDILAFFPDNSKSLKLTRHLQCASDYLCDNKCGHNKWYKTSYALEVQKGHDILQRGSCQLPCVSTSFAMP